VVSGLFAHRGRLVIFSLYSFVSQFLDGGWGGGGGGGGGGVGGVGGLGF